MTPKTLLTFIERIHNEYANQNGLILAAEEVEYILDGLRMLMAQEREAIIPNTPNTPLKVGDKVRKRGGDYSFPGVVIGVMGKQSPPGAIRYAVESTSPETKGMIHIYSLQNLELRDGDNELD